MTKLVIPHSRPWITEADRYAVERVLNSGLVANGDKVKEFEAGISDYLGVRHTVAQSCGTAALILGLRTLEITQGDEVILPTYVCRSVLEAVLTVGASPVPCEVNDRGVITADTVAPNITGKTKAIIAAHIFGNPCSIERLKIFGVPVIDDACQALGLSLDGKMAGSLGDIGIVSFHATKCLTTGEGGMLVTNNPVWAERARHFAEGSVKPAARSAAPLSDLQAALGISQLARYNDFLACRQELRSQYNATAKALGLEIGNSDQSDMIFRFTVRTEQKFDLVAAAFRDFGIIVRRGVDELLHRSLGLNDVGYPTAVRLYQQTISVPFYPSLSINESRVVTNAFRTLNNGLGN